MQNNNLKLVVLISGTGTTLINLQKLIAKGELQASIELVVSSRKKAPGIKKAAKHNLVTKVLGRKKFVKDGVFDGNAYSSALAEIVEPYSPQLVVMGGFMTKLESTFLNSFKVINVHPALLPDFGGEGYYGLKVHEAVLKSGVRVSGATVHFADAGFDTGPIILREELLVFDDDTPQSLAKRVQALERKLLPLAIRLFANGQVICKGNKCKIIKK